MRYLFKYAIHSCFLFTWIALMSSCIKEHEAVKIDDLQCAYLTNPLGIDTEFPSLSWKLRSDKNGVRQTAYKILVAGDKKTLDQNIGDIWDTGKVESDQSVQVKYRGSRLQSRQKVYWKVMIWDQEDVPTAWSETASWEMGLLREADWQAKWIGKKEQHEPKVAQKNPARYFRQSFMIDQHIAGARVYISGLGYYELYINGDKVGDHVLSPNQTNYDRRQAESFRDGQLSDMSARVLYETHDIAPYLREGENVISVTLGNGWYFQTTRSEYLPLFYDSPRFIAQFEIDYQDGSEQVLISDEHWLVGTGPIIDNNLHHGEIYDARLEDRSWNTADFNVSGMEKASIVRAPEGKLKAQMSPPDRVVDTIEPISILQKDDRTTRFDFGTMFSGWVRLRINGNRGDEVKLTFFEDTGNTYEQTDTYILKGEGTEVWEPKFTWHAFRYVDVSGATNELTIENLEGKVVNTDVKTSGVFESSNGLFNQINGDFVKTQLGNMHGGVPTDCPHRERRGYTGDGQIAAQAAIFNFDMQSFYTKWLNDIADAQDKVTGYVPNTVPYHSGGGGTPWGSAYIILPWYIYMYYGDSSILEKHYEGMKRYLSFLETQTDDTGLIVEKELGEWVPPEKTEIPPSFVSSAYYFYDLSLIQKTASVLGKTEDAAIFSANAERVKEAFNKKYYNPKSHTYSIGRQGANVFPLAFGMVPKQLVEGVFQSLVYNVEVNEKGHFDTGMMGTPYLLEVLTKYGRPDLAYTVMNRRDFPSFGYNIERGATTLWETWSGNDSHSHPMFGSVSAWFFQGLGGIKPNPDMPGFKHVIIKPAPVNELEYVHTSYASVYGNIVSDWELKDGDLKLDIVIPPNTRASIFIPGDDVDFPSEKSNYITFVKSEEGYKQFDVVSGKYTFISKDIGSRLLSPMLSIPVIEPSKHTAFTPDSIEINIRQYSGDAEIRYTLDGSEPNKDSKLFTAPFSIYESTYVKAKVFRDDVAPGYPSGNKVVFIDSLTNGLKYEYYLGAWNNLPDYDRLKPERTGYVYKIDLNEFDDLDNQFGIRFTGEIEIGPDGIYTFYLVSNDGSKLFIDGDLVIDTDGLHSFSGSFSEKYLSSGRHRIRLDYFQAGGGKGLDLEYEGPNVEKQLIPADVLFKSGQRVDY